MHSVASLPLTWSARNLCRCSMRVLQWLRRAKAPVMIQMMLRRREEAAVVDEHFGPAVAPGSRYARLQRVSGRAVPRRTAEGCSWARVAFRLSGTL